MVRVPREGADVLGHSPPPPGMTDTDKMESD